MAKVFLSCGQRGEEKELALQVQELIQDEFDMECYNADRVQGFDDVMSITEQLSKSDYYLFIDFKREGELPISVFTHQEFALARAWEITEMLAFIEEGLEKHGMLGYVLAHPVDFKRENLIDVIRENIIARGWENHYSRNLVICDFGPTDTFVLYGDHTGQSLERVWHLRIQNKRKDKAALNTICVLQSIENEDTGEIKRPDVSNLKWAGHLSLYQKTILPEDFGSVDAFAIRVDQPGIFMHSLADVARKPVEINPGTYSLNYRIYSDSFPLLKVKVRLNYIGPYQQIAQQFSDPGNLADLA